MSMNPLTLLEKAINEHGSAAILKERLALAADKFKQLEDDNRKLKEMNQKLEEEVIRLSDELEQKSASEEFVKARGVLFHKLPNGQIERDAYCPACKRPMSSLARALPYKCSKCEFTAGFTGKELDAIIKTINA